MLLSILGTSVLGASALASGLAGPSRSSRPDSKIARNVLEGKAEGYCSPSGPIESTNCLYETVESINKPLFPALQKLVKYPFFRHYKVDLYRECPFWYENGFCMNRACGVEATDETEIPEKWRAKALSEVRHDTIDDGVSGCYFREQDYCYIEDDATQDGQYIDLSINPERFTGYAGDSAHHVWQAIYEENCFGLSEAAIDATRYSTSSQGVPSLAAAVAGAGSGGRASGSLSGTAGFGFSKLSEGWGTEMIKAGAVEEMCEEKKVYYRVISGLHASISIHICHDYLDQATGEWVPNLQCFINRLATHPERLSNVYFNAVLLMRAMARAASYLEAYDVGVAPVGRFGTKHSKEWVQAKRAEDKEARQTLKEVLSLAKSDEVAHGFDEGDFFTGEDALILKEQFKTHFRNVSRIMDCVGCDKCRLWGKLQVSGLGTAMKILFELDDAALDPKVNPDLLQRSEVVALFNTMHRVSESLAAVDDFRKMYAATQAAAKEKENLPPAPKVKPKTKTKGKWRASSKKSKPVTVSRTPEGGAILSWSYVVGLSLSAYEAVRRGCQGCWEVCWKSLGKGPLGRALDWIGQGVGTWTGRVEL